ncbi:MAG TPA: phosphatase domain-containing protein [Pseudonocardiaceae bacterium]|nr:phosphatase domain-containing protein [Pseudonocardiaceae bacterium]
MLAEGTLGVVYDVDGVLRLGTLRRQLRRIRGLVRSSTRDHRSVLGMPHAVRALGAEQPDAPMFYLTAVPISLAGPFMGLLERDGYPLGTVLMADRALAPWWLFGGGISHKRAVLDRLIEARPQVRWVLIGDDAGHDPDLYTDLARRAPDRVAAIGLRQALDPGSYGTGQPLHPERVNGVPVVRAPNGEELLPLLRASLGLGQPRSAGVQDWFLTRSERGNDATRLRAWTEGNAVRPLVHGRTYFSVLLAALASAGAGDSVLLSGWRADCDELLREGAHTVCEALSGAARRGVLVRGLLWRSHPSSLGYFLETNRNLAADVAAAGGEVLLDQRVRPLGCHHQKLVAIRYPQRPPDDVAFLGGIDLALGRRDDAMHGGDPQPVTCSARFGHTPAEHDVQVQLRGPAVREVEDVFRERWEDPSPLSRLPWQVLFDRFCGLRRIAPPLPPAPPDPPQAGTCAVQILRTYPTRRPRSPFAPRGERSLARAYAKALSRAQRIVYVEDQYLWSVDVARIFAAALRRSPRLNLIAVAPRFPDVENKVYLDAARLGHGAGLAMVYQSGADRVQIFDVENHQGWPVYVHAKVCVVDDVWAIVGSANLNLRSWTHDSELSAAVLDDERDTRAPVDPGGLGDGARRLARDLRLELMREHLDLDDDTDLLDPDRAAQALRDSAARLDAWHAGGRLGRRPPGRLRRHTLAPPAGRSSAWLRWLTRPAYRAFLDPDGRPLAMKLRRTY